MKRKTLKKALSAFLSLLMCMMTLLSISTPVFAATTVDAYMVDFPRDGDSNYSATAWGHSATSLMGGWRFLNSKYTTVLSLNAIELVANAPFHLIEFLNLLVDIPKGKN